MPAGSVSQHLTSPRLCPGRMFLLLVPHSGDGGRLHSPHWVTTALLCQEGVLPACSKTPSTAECTQWSLRCAPIPPSP